MIEAKIRVPSPPTSPKTVTTLPRGTTIAGRFRIQSPIGAGNMGMVYVAEHLQLHKKVAVKVLDPGLAEIPNAALRFQREAQATSRIDHPNVAQASDYGRLEDGTMYLVLEYVDGRSLRRELESGPLPLARALRIAEQIAAALGAAHALGIVHRDLKPENVMLVGDSDDDLVKVLDFGIARIPQPDEDNNPTAALTKAGAVFGTPEYMAPEQAIGQRVDARADFYSLGVILFEMLAGVRPYVAESAAALLGQQLTAKIPTFAERVPDIRVPLAVERVVQRLLGKRPAERYQHISDVIAVLSALRNDTSEHAAHAAVPLPAFELGTRLTLEKPDSDDAAAPAAMPPVVLAPPPVPSVPPMANVSAKVEPESARSWRATGQALLSKLADTRRRLVERVDRGRSHLPKATQQRLAAVSSASLLAWFGLGLCFVVTGLFVAARRDTSSVAQPALALSAARVATIAPASAALAASPPTSPDEVSELIGRAQAKLREGDAADAVASITRVLAKDPDRRSDQRVTAILFQAATSPTRTVADSTFALLQGAMAGSGAEVLYWLARDRGIPAAARRRAEQIVAADSFERSAPRSVRYALQLQRADSCEKKHELLKQVSAAEGELVLPSLRELTKTSGCGLRGDADCYPCLRKDGTLDDAIRRLEERGQ